MAEVKAYLTHRETKIALKLKKAANKWLFEDDNEDEGPESIFTLPYICRHLGKNIDRLRSRVLIAEKLKLSLYQFIALSESGKLDKILEELHNAARKHGEIQQEGSGSSNKPIRKAIKNAEFRKVK
jgi:hypothetical protein